MTATAQLCLLDFLASPPAPPPAAPPPRAARIAPPPRRSPAAAFAPVDLRTLAILAGVSLLREIEGDRVALEPAGWHGAMAERARLVQHQMAGTLTPGNAAVLATLQRLHLALVGETADQAVIVPAYALEDLHDALAGLRLAAMETPDGT
jgi:hypothetical protein